MRELIALRYPNRRLADRLQRLWGEEFAALPLSPSLHGARLEQLLQQLKPSGIEDEHGFTRLDDGIPVEGEVALVVTTSGTSGAPKGVELSHRALRWSAEAVNRRLGATGDDRWLVCLPVAHIAGIGILVRSLVGGTVPIVHDGFDVEAIAAEQQTTLISLVPTTLKRLLDAGVDLSSYRAVLVGGGPIPARLMKRAHDAGVPAIRTYGMTETCGGCNYGGFPLQGAEMRVDQEQILIRGPMLMERYRLQPDLTKEALSGGWFHTSDLGRIDPSGRLEVLGRLDDVIVTGGEKVSASEVESLLKQHDRVADAAVVGLDDAEWGQAVAAVIVAKGSPPTPDELRAWVRTQASAAMAPKRLIFVEDLPRSDAGKLQRSALAELFL
jgi:o-succinylbenzoate---CoA ligase